MSDRWPYSLSFMFATDVWFEIAWGIPKRGYWRWQIKHPLKIERLD